MRGLLLLCVGALLPMVAMVGCGSSGGTNELKSPEAPSIVGSWKGDPDSARFDWGDKGTDATEKKRLDQQIPSLKAQMAKTSATFKEDGTYVAISPSGAADSGKYSLEGSKVLVTPAKAPDPKRARPTLTLSGDGKTIAMRMVGEGVTIEFNLVKS